MVLTIASMISRRNKTFLTDHTLTLTPEGVTEETAFNTATHTWTGVVRVARTSHHLFSYIAQHAAHVVPRNAVSTQQDWDALYELVRKGVAAARAA